MIARTEANRLAHDAHVDLHLAQQEVVLLYALDALAEADLLPRLAFKGGTYLRFMVTGDSARLSEDLDFTNLGLSNDPTPQVGSAFAHPHHGVQFRLGEHYRTSPGNWACTVEYVHGWDEGQFQLEVRYRESPFLPPIDRRPVPRRWFSLLPFATPLVRCLRLEEAISEKLRAVQQRTTERDLFDAVAYSRKSFDQGLVRLLTVGKLWADREAFRPEELLGSLRAIRREWPELDRLTGRTHRHDWNRELEEAARRFRFLGDLTPFELRLIGDARRHALDAELRAEVARVASSTRGNAPR